MIRAALRCLLGLTVASLLAACGTTHAPPRHGAYYQDDGPGDHQPANLDQLQDAVPRVEPYASGANRPYTVFGKEYVPDTSDRPYDERGIASWYGRKFNGQRTSSGEIYDMYAMTAAHPTLPIPSYAKVTNLANGRSVIVRINDRGPFHSGRIIDLSFAAAYKLGYASQGSTQIEVEHLLPRDILAGRYPASANLAQAAPPSSPAPVVAAVPAPAPAVAAITTPVPVAESTTVVALESASSAPPVLAPPARALDPDVPLDLVAAPSASAGAAGAAGQYLQLGAFRVKSGADDFVRHMARELDPGLAAQLRVVSADTLYRVQMGPYSNRQDAETVAQQLHEVLGYNALIISQH